MSSIFEAGLRRFIPVMAAVAAMLLLVSCSGDESSEEPPAQAPSTNTQNAGSPTVITRNLEAPWSIAFRGETPLVSERDSSRILELDGQGNSREVGKIEGAAPSGEGGLLGIAVRDGHLYMYFTANGENRIERRKLNGQAGSLSLGPAETILDGLPSSSIHNGGRIAFGPDGMLYATVGDAGVPDAAQDRESLGGKILRMKPDGSVPDDNPFDGSPVYSYGHRNPQGIAWLDGSMYASEFGQDTWDELNVIEPGGNYGWPEVEGIANQEEFIDPVQQWAPSEASPSGIATGGGSIYIANLRGERLRVVPTEDLGSSTEMFTGQSGDSVTSSKPRTDRSGSSRTTPTAGESRLPATTG